MAKPVARIRGLEVVFAIALLAVLARAAQLQLVQGGDLARRAESQRTSNVLLPARRGTIFDRHGEALALTQVQYQVALAPHELRRPDSVAQLLTNQLGLSAGRARRATTGDSRWVPLPGRHTALAVAPLRGIDGVYLESQSRRFYPDQGLAASIIGRLDSEGQGAAGLELMLDDQLRGQPGEAVMVRDPRGRNYDSPSRHIREPVPGRDVYLTLDAQLQDIAERGLATALDEREAEAGEVIFVDPRSGEILAISSQRRGGASSELTAVTSAFEPGSTAKLFAAAALLETGKADSSAREYGEAGTWRMAIVERPTRPSHYRIISDEHEEDRELTMADAIRVSSNIVMAKLARRLSPEEQFLALRSFGFGAPTGIEFPSESWGTLRPPQDWRPLISQPSHAIGYEFSVTMIQLAAAYAAIANDGILLTPTFIREIRDQNGRAEYRHRPTPVRRVVSSEVAATLREFLRGAVLEGGTGTRAQLDNYPLAGKTGTARVTEDGRYIWAHRASFAALFPADDPQLVVVVKFEKPRRGIYGGQTAAPVTRTMLNDALAARGVEIDRRRLALNQSATEDDARRAEAVPPKVIAVSWPGAVRDSVMTEAVVPDVVGLDVRTAVRQLHAVGLQVSLNGTGAQVVRASLGPGREVSPGTTVTLWTR